MMRNKNLRTCLVVCGIILLLATAITGCGSPAADPVEQPGETPAPAQTINIDASLFVPEGDIFAIPFKWWMEEVESRTEGRVQITPYYAGSLATIFETLDAVRDGSIDMGLTAASATSGEITELAIMEPISAYGQDIADPDRSEALYEAAHPIVAEIFAQRNTELLFWGPCSTQNFTVHTDRFLIEPEHYRGQTIRGAGRWQAEQIAALGASAISIDPSELYVGLQQGTLDGAIQIAGLTLSGRLYEVAPYMVSLNMPQNTIYFIINNDVWNEIPEADRDIIKEVSREASVRMARDISAAEIQAIAQLKEEGAEVYELSEGERQAYYDAFKPVFDDIENISSSSPEGEQLVEIMRDFRDF